MTARATAPVKVDRSKQHELRMALVSNSVLTLGLRVMTTVLALLTVPWLLSALGATGFGVYSVIVGITGLATFVDAGLAVGVRTRVAEAAARGDAEGARRAVSSGFALLVMITFAVALLFLVSTAFVPWTRLLGASSTRFESVAVTALGFYLLLYVLSLPTLPAQRALEGVRRVKAVTALTAVPALVLFAGIYALRDQHELVPFAVLAGTAPLITGIIGVLLFRRLASDIFPRRFKVGRSDLHSLWVASWPMVIVSVALSLSYALDPVIVAANLGADAVAQYALANRIAQIGNLVYVSTVPVLWTHFAQQRSLNTGVPGVVPRLTLVYACVATGVGAALVVLGPAATELWSRGDVRAPQQLFLAFAVWGVVLAAHLPSAMVQTDPRSLRFQACTTSVMAAVNVPLSLVLVTVMGVSGPVWASALTLSVLHATPTIWRARRLSISAGTPLSTAR